ncbi:hypothetical protein F511_33658 [Dorcoceras hygrometricum]|uniref:Uncharacterized protein n=1 Tax=Dorcoceras hygrometricum TaxID=472368 RepID=A0A2Z7A7Y1_9LAMI|nr:hypothetical protein F511_33658 [Dorcoceras hygrometricum]
MQHAIIFAMKCMRAIKDRIARPASPVAIITIEPLYHAQQVSRWKSSVRDLQDPSAHHSSVVFRHDKSVGHHSDDSVGLFRHDKSVGPSQRDSQSGHQSICQAQYVLATRQISIQREMLTPKPKPAGERTKQTSPKGFEHQYLHASTPTLIQGFKWVAIKRATHKESSATKITRIIGRERRESTEIGHGEQ